MFDLSVLKHKVAELMNPAQGKDLPDSARSAKSSWEGDLRSAQMRMATAKGNIEMAQMDDLSRLRGALYVNGA